MSDVQNTKFKEELGGFFYDMLKAAGMTMTPGNFPERVRDIGSRMAKSIELAAERQSVKVIEKLQEAVLSAFNGFENEYDARIESLKRLVLAQQELINELMKKDK